MSKAIIVVTIFLVAIIEFGSSIEEDLRSLVELVDNFDTLQKQNTGLNLTKIDGNVILRRIYYSTGRRVPGDINLGQKSESFSFAQPQDFTITLFYPQNGIGRIVTFFEIIVDQSSIFGYGKILSGGIGQRQIAIEVIANATYYFNYSAHVYGY